MKIVMISLRDGCIRRMRRSAKHNTKRTKEKKISRESKKKECVHDRKIVSERVNKSECVTLDKVISVYCVYIMFKQS